MSVRRGLLLLAITAALVGAPSVALAAAPNLLTDPTAAPSVGTTSTPFVLTVRYVSAAGNPATSVTAQVAGRTVLLSLVAGAATDGLWRGSASLPVGGWPVTFRASTAKGPQPSIGGVTVTVLALAPSPTPAYKTADPSPTKADEEGSSTPPPTPDDGPAASGDPGTTATPGQVAASTAPSAAGSPAAPAGSAGTAGAPPGGTTTAPAGGGPGSSDPPQAGASPSAGASWTEGAPNGGEVGGDGQPGDIVPDDAMLWTIMIGGLVAVAGVALLGSAWLFLGRRRLRAENVPAPVVSPPAPPADAVAMRRRQRRARREASEDPVLAAMGLDPPRTRPRVDGASPRPPRPPR